MNQFGMFLSDVGPFKNNKVNDWHPSATVTTVADRVRLTPFHGVKYGTLWNVIRSLMTDFEVGQLLTSTRGKG